MTTTLTNAKKRKTDEHEEMLRRLECTSKHDALGAIELLITDFDISDDDFSSVLALVGRRQKHARTRTSLDNDGPVDSIWDQLRSEHKITRMGDVPVRE